MGHGSCFAIRRGKPYPWVRTLELRDIDGEYSARRTCAHDLAGPPSAKHQHAVVLLLARPPGAQTFQAGIARSNSASGYMGAGCPGSHENDPPDGGGQRFVCWIRTDIVRLSGKFISIGARSLQDRAFRAAEIVFCGGRQLAVR